MLDTVDAGIILVTLLMSVSDGEFVMTAEAVRNAGGGDRNLGAARMYDLMSRFEGGRA